jgi:NFU1 iron-sulfur cluster scaffold homolog, mitochondrial
MSSVEKNEFFDVKVMVQPTPNPDAYKFICNREIKAKGNATFNNIEECGEIEIARQMFMVEGVKQVYFFENVATVTFAAAIDLLKAEDAVIEVIKAVIPYHNPEFELECEKKVVNREELPKDIRSIEEILDRTIRPGLQGDGGDVEIVSLIENELAIRYQGACGTCPSSTMNMIRILL